MERIIFNIFGIFGLVSILLAFLLLQKKKITDDDHIYNILNIVGGITVGVYTFYYKAYFSVALNFIWVLVALWDLLKNLKKAK